MEIKKEIVSIVNCESYDSNLIRNVLVESLKNINFDLKSLKGKTILIKPNLLAPHKSDDAVTTNPIFLEELCKLLKSVKVKKIIIGDSSAFDTDKALEVCGINNLKKYAEVINFEKMPKKLFSLDDSESQRVSLPKILFEVDLVIDFAKLKTHGLTQVTLCTKNLYGCVPGKLKEQLHRVYPGAKEFSILLSRIEMQIKPKLCFIDGVVGLEGEGPGASGMPISSKVLIAGTSCGAVDIIGTELMGFKPMSIYTNKNSGIKREDIGVVGSGKDVRLKFKRPSSSAISVFFWLNKIFPKPKIIADEKKCVRCGICVKKCPVHALSLSPYAVCNHNICIKCLCCVEVCPHDAIHLEEPALRKFLSSIASKVRKV
jgi:uncharacterized protein (DUF362 family)/NAD-dependent dihydropyrimidine dehydrogenase PreA subunit